MTILDGPMGAVAQTLIGTFGRPATLVREGASGTFNPATGTVTGGDPDSETAVEVVFSEYAASQIDGTLIQVGDRRAIVSRVTLGTTPTTADTLTEGGRTWQIVRVEGFSTGAEEAAYELQVRR